MSTPKIGGIIEIQTKKGLFYAQYTHKHKQYGALLRIFDEPFQCRPTEFSVITSKPVRFSTFFPLRAALKRGIFEIVSNEPVPSELIPFPTFRGGIVNHRTKKIEVWWLWNGKKEWKIGPLTDIYRRLPIRGIWNDTMLIHRLESGWRPEIDAV